MWNFVKNIINNKSAAFKKEEQDIVTIIEIFNKFEQHNLVFWRPKDKILLIEESLATMNMAGGREAFQKFLDQAALWQNARLINDGYEAHRIKVETDAVRQAQKKFAMLTKADIARIRQNARQEMPMLPLEKLNYIKEFDIFIVRGYSPSAQNADREGDELLAVGHYDGQKVEMAMYEDIKHNLSNSKSNDTPEA